MNFSPAGRHFINRRLHLRTERRDVAGNVSTDGIKTPSVSPLNRFKMRFRGVFKTVADSAKLLAVVLVK